MTTPSKDIELPRGTIADTPKIDPMTVVSPELGPTTETKATVDGVWNCQASGSQPVLVIANDETTAISMLKIWYGKDIKYTIEASTRHPMLGEDVMIQFKKSDNLTLRPWQGHHVERLDKK